jgi:hypothetical protein
MKRSLQALKENPYRFRPGQKVYARGWPTEQPAIVTTQLQHRGFPHYLLVDDDGHEWQIAQVELSSKPIPLG